jgi:hypothetical protein
MNEYEKNLLNQAIRALNKLLAGIPENETEGEKALREIQAMPLPWEVSEKQTKE